MALNSLGLGFVFQAKDLATPTMDRVTGKFRRLDKTTKAASVNLTQGLATMRTTGLAMAAAGAAVLFPMQRAATETAEFGKQIAEITTLSGAAVRSNEELSRSVREAAVAYGQDTQAEAKALYDIISAGADTAAKQNSVFDTSNRLAVGGITDVATAADGLTTQLNAFGISMEDSMRVADAMFIAVDKGKTTIPELASSIGRVASTANDMGLSVEQTNAAIAAMTAKGLQTSRAVTGLQASLANIKKPTTQAKDEAKRLGIEFDSMALRRKGVVKFLTDITSNAKFTETTLEKLFGSVEAGNAMVGLTANNMQGFTDALEAMENKAGATDKAFEKIEATLDFQLKQFAALRKDIRLTVGQALAPLIRKLVDFGTRALNAFKNLDPHTQEFLVRMLAIGGALAVVGGGATFLVGQIGQMASAAKAALPALLPLMKILLPIAAAALLAVGAFKLFQFAYEENLGGLRDFLGPIVEKTQLFFRALKQLFTDGFLSGDVLTDLQKVENEGVLSLLGAVVRLGFRLKKFVEGVATGFTKVIRAMGPTIEKLVVAFKRLGTAIGLGGDDLSDFASGPSADFLKAGEKLGAFFGDLVNFIVEALAVYINVYSRAIEVFKGGLELIQPIFDMIGETFDEVVVKLDTLAQELGFAGGSGEALAAIFEVVGTVIGAIWTAVAGGISVAVLAIMKTFSFMISGVTFVVQAFKAAKAGVTNAWEGVVEFFEGIWEGIKTVIDDMIATLVQVGSAIPEHLRPAAVDNFIKERTQGLNLEVSDDIDNFGAAFGAQPIIPLAAPAAPGAQTTANAASPASVEEVAARMAELLKDGIKVDVKVDGEKIATAARRGSRANSAAVFGGTPGVGE